MIPGPLYDGPSSFIPSPEVSQKYPLFYILYLLELLQLTVDRGLIKLKKKIAINHEQRT
jgi:hypothetical protein